MSVDISLDYVDDSCDKTRHQVKSTNSLLITVNYGLF